MPVHKFSIGDKVTLSPAAGTAALPGAYEVLRQLPSDGDEQQYRVKHTEEKHERVAKESQLRRVRT